MIQERVLTLAHVVVEPSTEFSLRLAQESGRSNPYGGTVGVCLPNKGIVRRLYLGGHYQSQRELIKAIVDSVASLGSVRSIIGGWDWGDLQEYQLRNLRKKASDDAEGNIKVSEIEEFYETIIKQKNKEISEKNAEIDRISSQGQSGGDAENFILSDRLIAEIGVELYPDEFSDRLKLSLSTLLDSAAVSDLDIRTKRFCERLFGLLHYSGRATAIMVDLKAAARKGKGFGVEMSRILSRLHYDSSQDGKHIKMTPPEDEVSGPVITLPKTAGDTAHGGENQASDIGNALGLKRMK